MAGDRDTPSVEDKEDDIVREIFYIPPDSVTTILNKVSKRRWKKPILSLDPHEAFIK